MPSDFKVNFSNQEMDKIMERADEMAQKHAQKSAKTVIEYKDDGVYLSVFPPQPSETPVSPEDIVRDMEVRKIEGFEFTKVRQIAREMKGEPVYIAPPQKEVIQDGTVRVEVSKDKLEAFIWVYPPRGGNPAKREDVDKALTDNNVVYGIREDVIQTALNLQNVSDPLLIARASDPIDGEDAKIELKAASGMRGKPTEMVDGRVDFYNLNLIQNVDQGEVLAVKTPATPGTPGYTVTGEEIPVKSGKDVQLAAGKNVELSEDSCSLLATAKGHLVVVGNKIGVSTVYEVNGDVDFNTGNVEFNGTVLVKGSIREGFKVAAYGDVEVMDTIADGIVECTGNLKVRNGIVGKKSFIKAGGSVFAKFIENSIVESGGDVVVGEAVMHSKVNAKKSLAVGGKGVIVGGIVRVGEEINCKIVGSPLATITELEAGISPELRQELSRLVKEKQTKEVDFDKADKAIKLLSQLKQVMGELPPDKLAIMARVTRVQVQLAQELEELKHAVEQAEYQILQSERGRILVQGVIHPGVKITIGSAYMQIQDDYPFVSLTRVGADIKINPYK